MDVVCEEKLMKYMNEYIIDWKHKLKVGSVHKWLKTWNLFQVFGYIDGIMQEYIDRRHMQENGDSGWNYK